MTRRAALLIGGLAVLGLLAVPFLTGSKRSSRPKTTAATAVTSAPAPGLPGTTTTQPPPMAAAPQTPSPAPASAPAPAPVRATRAPAAASSPPTGAGPMGLAAAWTSAGARNVVGPPARGQGGSAGPAPVRIEIPSIGVDRPVDALGLNPDGTLDVPEDFGRSGYYTGRPSPGDTGPAIVVGHIDNKSGPAAFYRLRELRPGQEARIHRADGSVVVFVVERSKQVPKNEFPTDEVYGPTPDPTLRLITCGGSFDRKSGHYRDNTVVFLRMKG